MPRQVVNGACKDKDMKHFREYFGADFKDLHMDFDADRQLLALQGKGAKSVLQRLAPALAVGQMKFMTGVASATVAGITGCRVTRCGYTGEDGFEIGVDPKHAVQLAEVLIGSGKDMTWHDPPTL